MQRESWIYWLNVQFGIGDLFLLFCVTVGVVFLVQRLKRCPATPTRTLAVMFLIPAPFCIIIHPACNAVCEGLNLLVMGGPIPGIADEGSREISRAGKVMLVALGCSLLLIVTSIWRRNNGGFAAENRLNAN